MAKKKLTIEDMLVPKEEIPYEVPENWCWVKWGFLGDFISGTGFKPKYQGFTNLEIPFYKVGSLKNIDSDGYICIDDNTINEDMRIELKAKIIPKNSILFAKVGEAIKLNRRALAIKNCCIDNNTMSFQCKENINYRYIYYWSKNIELYDYSNATTVPSIRKSDLEHILVPLAPLAEQERIVNRIESLFEKVDKASELVEEAREGFEKRRAAILEKAFSGELTKSWRVDNGISNEWEKYKLKDIAEFKSGYAFKSTQFSESGIPVIRMGNLYNATLDLSRKPVYIPNDYDSKIIEKYSVSKGDILLTLTGTKYKRDYGFAVLVENEERLLLNQRILSLRAKEYIDNKYLLYYLKTDLFRDVFFSAETGGVNQGNVSSKFVENIEIPLPSIREQKEISTRIEKLLSKEEYVETLTDISDISENIKKAILAKAFRGELKSNDLREESSINLLNQIIN